MNEIQPSHRRHAIQIAAALPDDPQGAGVDPTESLPGCAWRPMCQTAEAVET
jgi:hypothetical protein